jgi:7-cyano-7-deazaguanine synthase in queuosine biosynthesis
MAKCSGVILLTEEVSVKIYDGPIGIMVSGGVDSAILLYYLMKHIKDTIHIYTTGSNLKYRRNSIIAPRVVEKCIELTGNNNVVHHIHYDEAATESSPCNAPQKDIDKQEINIVYDGTTMNPPHDIASQFTPKLGFDSSRSDTGNNIMLYNDDKFYMPWANTNKKDIAGMYRKENLIDSLLPTTRSCEYDPTCEYFDNIKDPGLEHCGECWWCKEKEWGFN